MAGILGLLAFISFIFLVIGLIKPALVQSILKRELTRGRVIKYFGGAWLVLVILIGVFTPANKVAVESDKIQGVAVESQTVPEQSPLIVPTSDVVVISSPSATPKPTPLPVVTPQPLAIPSNTPNPTATPTIKPTPTPNPSVAPTPKPTIAPTPTPAPITAPKTVIDISGGDKDCKDFISHSQAQAYFNAKGGSASNNVDDLDRDHDGIACESL